MDLFTEEQKITLYFQKENNMVEMTCKIEKVYDDRLDLILPQYFMRYINFLQVGSFLTAKAFTKLGTIDFNTIVMYSPLEDTFTIELDYNSVKLTSNEDIPTINAIERVEISTETEPLIYKTFEISTNYIKLYCDKKLELEKECNCKLVLPKDYGIIKFIGIVSEIDAVYDNEYTITYRTMSETDRQNLLYYMFMYSNNND